MKKTIAATFILVTSVFAQDPQKMVIELKTKLDVVASESLPELATPGAPLSAEETTTTTQMLLDGNRIVNTSTTKVYRDSQGRTRTEHTFGNIGSIPAGKSELAITINDPVANVRYTLEPDSRTAYKVSRGGDNAALREKLAAEIKAQNDAIKSNGGSMATARRIERPSETEDLGTSNMSGVAVKGTRTTTVIPAGSVGNDRDIAIVNERWYSPDLKMNIMTRRSDPRMGDTVFQVNSLTRGNPDPSLFQVPADYQLKENPRGTIQFVTKD